MKDMPINPDGPMGPYYKKVNELIAKAMEAEYASDVEEILGEPDEIESVPDDERIPDGGNMPDRRYPEKYFVYNDPYRLRKSYRFGISERIVIERITITKST